MGDLKINTNITPVQQQSLDKTQPAKTHESEKNLTLRLKLIEIVKQFLFGLKSNENVRSTGATTVLKGLNQASIKSTSPEEKPNQTERVPVSPRPKNVQRTQTRQPQTKTQPKVKSDSWQTTTQKKSISPQPKIGVQRVRSENKQPVTNQQKIVHGPIPIPPRPEISRQRAQSAIKDTNEQESFQVPIQHKHQDLSQLRKIDPPRERTVTLSHEQGPILALAYQSLSLNTSIEQETPPPLPPRDDEIAPPLPPRDAEEPPPLPPRDDEIAPPLPPRDEALTEEPPPLPTRDDLSAEEGIEEPEQNFEVYGGIVINKSMLGKAAQVEEEYEVPQGDSTDEEWEMDTQEDLETEGNFKKAKTTEDYQREFELKNQQQEVTETPQAEEISGGPNLFDAIRKRRQDLNEDE